MQRMLVSISAIASVASTGLALGESRPSLDAALRAAEWIDSHTVQIEAGVTWAIDPEGGATQGTGLYAGSAGVVLFFTELWRATDDPRWRDLAFAGADELCATLPDESESANAGLYTGVAGTGFVLARVGEVSGEHRFTACAQRCVDRIVASAEATDTGVSWGPVTDIIGGGAGTGLFLLYAHEMWDDAEALDLATRAGRHLINIADKTEHGLSWRMTPDYERLMPNFSHGTAGIAFFLARLYEETGDEAFLNASLAGAAHIEAIADTSDGGFRVHHHTPDGEDLYYMGWCHGPVGTSRLFQQLHRATGDAEWLSLIEDSARSILASGAPEERSPGYWETVGRCCGSAGMGEFFLEEYERTGDPSALANAGRCAADVLSRATASDDGLMWVQAEHRVRPELLVAQTGLMQGAAGIGLMLLRHDALATGRTWALRLPDEATRGGRLGR